MSDSATVDAIQAGLASSDPEDVHDAIGLRRDVVKTPEPGRAQ